MLKGKKTYFIGIKKSKIKDNQTEQKRLHIY